MVASRRLPAGIALSLAFLAPTGLSSPLAVVAKLTAPPVTSLQNARCSVAVVLLLADASASMLIGGPHNRASPANPDGSSFRPVLMSPLGRPGKPLLVFLVLKSPVWGPMLSKHLSRLPPYTHAVLHPPLHTGGARVMQINHELTIIIIFIVVVVVLVVVIILIILILINVVVLLLVILCVYKEYTTSTGEAESWRISHRP